MTVIGTPTYSDNEKLENVLDNLSNKPTEIISSTKHTIDTAPKTSKPTAIRIKKVKLCGVVVMERRGQRVDGLWWVECRVKSCMLFVAGCAVG